MKQTVNPVHLLQKNNNNNNNNNKKTQQSVHKEIVWALSGHHGSVNQLNMKKLAVLST